MTTLPQICAHAGCEGTPPDSLASVEAGLAAGADLVELDLRFTTDGVAVLSHDPLDRRGSPWVTVDQALEVLARAPQVGINLDVKEWGPPGALPRVLTPGALAHPVLCTGLRLRDRRRFHRSYPGMAHGVNDLPWWFPGASLTVRRSYLGRLRAQGVAGLNLPFSAVTPALMGLCHGVGLPVWVWTVDDPRTMERMIDLGVSVITTNAVGVLRGLLGAKG